MKIVLRWYWTASGFFKKYGVGISIGVIIGIIAFTNQQRIIKLLPFKKTVYIGRVGVATLNKLPLDIQQLVSRGLTQINQDGKVELDIAQTMSISDDGSTYTFTIKPSSFWSDGTKLISHDINLALNDVESHPISDEAISFKLQQQFAPFPSIISQPILKRVVTGMIFKKTKIIGLNDYSITKIKTNNDVIKSLTLTSKNDTLRYRFYPTEQEAITAYKLGHIDQIDHLSSKYLEDWPNSTIIKEPFINRYLALLYNVNDPNLQDKTIRQMLTYATPKKTDDSRIISPISKHSWYYNPQVKPYNYNQETAKQMMDKLIQANPNLQLSFTISTTPAYAQSAQEIVDSWTNLGINTSLQIVPFPDVNDYQVLLIGQQIPDDPDQYTLWHTTQSSNITKYKNSRIDKLLEDGRSEIDVDKRKAIYQDFQRFLVEDCPAAFLNELYTYSLQRKP